MLCVWLRKLKAIYLEIKILTLMLHYKVTFAISSPRYNLLTLLLMNNLRAQLGIESRGGLYLSPLLGLSITDNGQASICFIARY
jgi:hypothetical protein